MRRVPSRALAQEWTAAAVRTPADGRAQKRQSRARSRRARVHSDRQPEHARVPGYVHGGRVRRARRLSENPVNENGVGSHLMRTHMFRTMLLAVLIIGTLSVAPALMQNGEGTGALAGTVKSADGTMMEGVVVSARSADHTWTTSVYSDARGQYKFPPLRAGQYAIWAQAKGYAVAKANANVAQGEAVADMRLEPLKDAKAIGRQLDGPEWFAALPE